MRSVWLVLMLLAHCAGGCTPAGSPAFTCPVGQCCYVGTSEFDLVKRSPTYGQMTGQTSVTSNIPCGSDGVSCGGGMCCWAGHICGPIGP